MKKALFATCLFIASLGVRADGIEAGGTVYGVGNITTPGSQSFNGFVQFATFTSTPFVYNQAFGSLQVQGSAEVPLGATGSANMYGNASGGTFRFEGPYGSGAGNWVATTANVSATGSGSANVNTWGNVSGSNWVIPAVTVPASTAPAGGKG